MSSDTPVPTGRAHVRYTPTGDGSEVSLPGYVNPVPAIVAAGDVVEVDARFVDQLTHAGRFAAVDASDVKSPNAGLTKAELADKLSTPDDVVDPAAFTKDELVELADAHDKLNPTPTGAGDNQNGASGNE